MKSELLAAALGLVGILGPSITHAAPALVDDAQAEPQGNEAAEQAAADPGIQLHFIPNQVSINRSVSFEQNGEPRDGNHNLSVGFRCEYVTDDIPLSYFDLKLTSVVTSSGESIDVNSDRHRHRGNNNINPHRHNNNQKPSFNVYFNLPAPRQAADSIREMRGTLKLQLSDGPERAISLSPISKYLGKRFKIVDMDDAPMSLGLWQRDDNDPPMLELTYPRSAQPLIRETTFVDARGQKLDVNRRGSSGSNNEMRIRYDRPDDKTTMIIRLFRQTREVEVPFVMRDIPLPAAEPDQPGFDFALETVPANLAEVRQPDAVEAFPGDDVQVIILD